MLDQGVVYNYFFRLSYAKILKSSPMDSLPRKVVWDPVRQMCRLTKRKNFIYFDFSQNVFRQGTNKEIQ